jgi:futalosine hydrolase
VSELFLVAAMERELFRVGGSVGLCCGIGPVEGALMTAEALARERYSAVLHVGIAGAVNLSPGTVVLGSEAIFCDLLDPQSTSPRVARLTADPDLIGRARAAMPNAPALAIATSARVGGGAGYEVEAMEGFGVLRAAGMAGVPALEMRAISNSVSNPDRSTWRIDAALEALEAAVAQLVPRLR